MISKKDNLQYYIWEREKAEIGTDRRGLRKEAWAGACEYKQIEVDKLQEDLDQSQSDSYNDGVEIAHLKELLKKEQERYKTLLGERDG